MEKIREVINKRIQEKKKNEFTDLAPIDDIENGAEYLKALHWAIKKKKVKNIALAGPYGAGKSSIIDTYLKKHRIIRSKSLRVSMATFVENETDEKGNPKKISLKQDEIELGILKQLFYKVNYKKIPQSRYRKLHKINWKRVWGYLVLIFLILGVMEFIFFPDTFQMLPWLRDTFRSDSRHHREHGTFQLYIHYSGRRTDNSALLFPLYHNSF